MGRSILLQLNTQPINTMLITEGTISANDHAKLVEAHLVLFKSGDPENIIKGIASAATMHAVNISEAEVKEGKIEYHQQGHVTAISPIAIGTTVDLVMSLAYLAPKHTQPVSYTHLTLPTILRV